MTLNPEQVKKVIEGINHTIKMDALEGYSMHPDSVKKLTEALAILTPSEPETYEAMLDNLCIPGSARCATETQMAEARAKISMQRAILTPSESVETEDNGLKPCPFCGGKASSLGRINYRNSYKKKKDQNAWHADGTPIDDMYFCNCVKCGASNKGLLGFSTTQNAIKAWNTRPLVAAAREQGAREATKECALKAVKFVVDEDLLTDGSYLSEELYKAIMGDSGKVEK